MPGNKEDLKLALRVLVSIAVEARAPDPLDVAALRKLAQTDEERSAEIDELARTVLLRESKRFEAAESEKA